MYETDRPPQGGFVPPPEEVRRAAGRYLKKRSDYLSLAIIVNLLLLYLLQTGVAWLVVRLVRATLPAGWLDVVNELYTVLVYGTAFLLPYLAYARAVRFPLGSIPRDRPYPPVLAASAGVVLGLSVAGLILSYFCALFFAQFGLMPPDMELTIPERPLTAALFFLNIAVVPALVEEFTYRGIVLGSLRPWGDRFAVGVSALLFALLHRNMAQFPNALLMGLALGYFLVKTNSIWTSVALHFCNNLVVLLVQLWTQGLDPVGQALGHGLLLLFDLGACAAAVWYFYSRRLDLRMRPSLCPLREGECLRRYFLNPPALLLLGLYLWVIYLNFT